MTDKSTKDLLAELDAEFGKQPRQARAKTDMYSAKAQLERMQFTNYYDWEQHKLQIEANEYAAAADWRPSWIPEARLTYCIRQYCETCGGRSDFIGGEYIRFRSKQSRATIVRRAEVCTDLWHRGLSDGDPLPDLVDHFTQHVARCPGCIMVEQQALDLWILATQPNPQRPLLAEDQPKPQKPTTTAELRALMRPMGEKYIKPKRDDLEINL